MQDHRLRRIELSHFKRFEHLSLPLETFNLLVGPNNSGKSTLLEACAFFDYCYRWSLERHQGELRFRASSRNDLDVLPAAEPADLWHRRRTHEGEDALPVRLAAELRCGHRYGFEVTWRFGRFHVEPDPENSPPVSPEEIGVVFIPGFTNFQPQEERRTPAVLREMRTLGQHGSIVRNLLLDLRADADRWRAFCDLLTEIFPDVALHQPEFDELVDRYIKVAYDELGREGGESSRFDLFSAGTGFHQYVQVFGVIFLERPTTILLDEPDAHLFSRLQTRLHDVLTRLVSEGHQVLAATHSPELIAAADPSRIVTFANGEPRRLQVRAEVSGTARSLGVFENVGLLLVDAFERVVVVEDRSDELYLRWWLEKVLAPERRSRLASRLVFLYAHQRPTPGNVNIMLDTLQQTFSEERRLRVDAFVVADRDYMLREELDAERDKLAGKRFTRQRWHVWRRVEIENYLVEQGPLARYVGECLGGPPDADGKVGMLLDEALEASRDVALERVVDAYSRTHRKYQASTCLKKAREHLERVWTPAGRLLWCDAKEVVLPRLRRELRERYRTSLPDRELIARFRPEEVDPDMRTACEALAAFVLGDSR